jgi:hypothetical protein
MKTRLVSILTIVTGLSIPQVGALAQTPVGTVFTYQGQLKEAGVLLTGDANFVFHAWDAEIGGNLVDSVSVSAVPVSDGLFTVELDFGGGLFNGEARWLEIEVEFPSGAGNWTTLTPRQPVNAAPYALYALNGGGGSAWETVGSDIYYDVGNVGIGTNAPLWPLQVDSTTLYTVYARNWTTTGAAYGGFFRSDSDSGYGVIGYASAATGGNVGVFGKTDSTNANAYGVYGRALATSGQGRAVYGRTESTEGTGVHGEAVAATGTNFGVRGTVTSPDGYAGYFTGGRNYFQGYVGIGEPDPQAALHVGGTPDVDGIMFPDGTLQTTAASGAGGLWTPDGSDIYYDAGRVGIGTDNPVYPLDVRSSGSSTTLYAYNSGSGAAIAASGSGTVFSASSGSSGDDKAVYAEIGSPNGFALYGLNEGEEGSACAVYGETFSSTGFGGYFVGRGYFSGSVGIGEVNPQAKLHIGGTPDVDGIMFPDGTLQTTAASGLGSLWTPDANDIYYEAGNVGIGSSNTAYPLDVRSDGIITLHARNTGSGSAIAAVSGSGSAVSASANASAGAAKGINAEAFSPDGFAVYGVNEAETGNAIGVYGESMYSPDGFGGYFDGRGYFSGNVGIGTTDPNCPLDVQSSSASPVIRAEATGSGVNYAIRGHTDSMWGYAGYFTGGRNYFEGNVGIGNSEPEERLDVVGVVKTNGLQVTNGAASGRVLTSDAYGYGTWQVPSSSPWTVTGADVYYDAGNVGIGTSSPTESLHVAGDTRFDGSIGVGTAPLPGSVMLGLDGDSLWGLWSVNTRTGGVAISGEATAESGGTTGVYGRVSSPAGVGVWGEHSASTGDTPAVYGRTSSTDDLAAGVKGEALSAASGAFTIGVYGVNHAGLGTGVYGEADYTDPAIPTYGGSFVSRSDTGIGVQGVANGANAYAGYFLGRGYFSGDVGIGTTSPVAKLDVAGTTRVDVLEIDGGADLSENFAVEGGAEPGMVVVINADRPGGLSVSQSAYDRRVAGIISGAGGVQTGMLMSQAGSLADGEHPVALTGRVYCWCDASGGAIEPGDMLTASDTPGHAMKVTDYPRAQGAIIGKAMTPLKEGKGLVLVLVNLQ